MNQDSHKKHTLQIRKDLLTLQKEILDSLKDQYDKENGRIATPSEWLQVIMVSQRYHWMRELTSLVADIDLLTELENITEEQAATVRSEVERLLFAPEDTTNDFAKHYKQLVMSGAPVLLPHGQLKSSLQPLPKKEKSAELAMAERKVWYEEHKVQSRKRRN